MIEIAAGLWVLCGAVGGVIMIGRDRGDLLAIFPGCMLGPILLLLAVVNE